MPIINIYNNPFKLAEKTPHFFEAGCTLVECLRVLYPNGFKTKTRVKINGKELKVDDFDVILAKNDVISIYEYPKGAALGAAGILGFGYLLYKGYQSTIDSLKSGTGVVDEPELPSSLKRNTGNAYNLRTASNVARLNEPIPTQYGKFGWYPDLAAQPYTKYTSAGLTYFYLLALGWGQFTINDILIGNNSIINSDKLTYTLYNPGTAMTEFNDNIEIIEDVKDVPFKTRYRSELGDLFDFDKTAKTITANGLYTVSFKDYFKENDTILVTGRTVSGYDGTYTITAITDTVITVSDSTGFSGSDTGVSGFISNTETCYLNPYFRAGINNRVLDGIVLNSEVSSGFFTIDNPNYDNFYVEYDIEYTNGRYAYDTNYVNNPLLFNLAFSVNLLLVPLDENGDAITEKQHILYTSPSMVLNNVSGNTYEGTGALTSWYNDALDDVHFAPEANTNIEFYESGVLIDVSDIASIDYINGQVTFNSSKTGDITLKNVVIQLDNTYVESLNNNVTYKGTLQTAYLRTGRATPFTSSTGTYYSQIYSKYTANIFESYYDMGSLPQSFLRGLEDNGTLRQVKIVRPDVQNYPAISLLAMTYVADTTDNTLPSENVFVQATRKLHQWSGSSWTGPTATRSIAWALADIWMATYGASRPYSKLDLDMLLTLDTLWTSRGDTFDGVFDSSITVWEALQKVARAGRAKPVFDGDTLSFVRDGALSTYTAMFNPDNILPNSFSLEYSFPDDQTPSGVKVKYYDEDDNYSPAEVESTTGLDKYKEVDFFGVVNYEQAWRESQFLEAQLLNQRLNVSFSTELAGHIPFVGDLISVQYDLPDWGQSGQVTAKSGTTITTSQPLDWTGSAPFYISFMEPDGSVSGPHTVTEGSTAYEAILDTDVTSFTFITTLANQNPTMYQFGPSTNWNKPCVITKITPQGDNETVAIDCVPYIAAIHTADTGTAPTKPSTTPSGNPIPPIVGGLELTNVPGSGSIVAVWNPLDGITSYKVQKSTDNSSWTDVSTPTSATETISATGLLYVRVASVVSATVGDYTKRSIVAT